MSIVDNFYKNVLNIIYTNFTMRINDKIKNSICLIASHGLAAIYIFLRMKIDLKEAFNIGNFDIACFVFFMLVFLVVFGTKHQINLEVSKSNRKFKILYFAFAIAMFISLIVIRPIWEIKISIIAMIFLFPVFYYISFNSDDYAFLIRKISIAFVNIGVLLHIGNYILYPYENNNIPYKASFENPNTLAMTIVPTLLCAIYLFSIEEKFKWFYLIVAGYTMGIIMLCESRTSIAMCIVSLTCWGIYYIVHSKIFKTTYIKSVITIILAICILIISVFVSDKINLTNNSTSTIKESVNIESQVEEQSSLDKVITKSKIRTGNDLDGFLSGRVELWKYYTKDITAFGHDYDAAKEQRTEDNITLGTHNTLISYLYICGLVPALIMLLIQLFVAIYIIKRMFCRYKVEEIENKRSLPQLDLFIILIAPAYCLAGLVEELIWVNRWAIATLFFISLAPMFYKRRLKRW